MFFPLRQPLKGELGDHLEATVWPWPGAQAAADGGGALVHPDQTVAGGGAGGPVS